MIKTGFKQLFWIVEAWKSALESRLIQSALHLNWAEKALMQSVAGARWIPIDSVIFTFESVQTNHPLSKWIILCPNDIMDYFLAGEDQQQTNQPNDQAGG